MADGVQLQLEASLSALYDAKKKSIFSAEEIRSIVKKRTKFEYGLRTRGANRLSFLKYVDYEWDLYNLVRQRAQKIGSKYKRSEADFAGKRKISHIHNRAVTKFPGDVDLWQRYLDSIVKLKEPRILKRILARAIQLHPRSSIFWVMAAKFEFRKNGNASAARALMQQAVSLNNDETKQSNNNNSELVIIFLEWFRLEVTYTKKLLLRLYLAETLENIKNNDNNTKMEIDDNNNNKLENFNSEIIKKSDLNEEENNVLLLSRSSLLVLMEFFNKLCGEKQNTEEEEEEKKKKKILDNAGDNDDCDGGDNDEEDSLKNKNKESKQLEWDDNEIISQIFQNNSKHKEDPVLHYEIAKLVATDAFSKFPNNMKLFYEFIKIALSAPASAGLLEFLIKEKLQKMTTSNSLKDTTIAYFLSATYHLFPEALSSNNLSKAKYSEALKTSMLCLENDHLVFEKLSKNTIQFNHEFTLLVFDFINLQFQIIKLINGTEEQQINNYEFLKNSINEIIFNLITKSPEFISAKGYLKIFCDLETNLSEKNIKSCLNIIKKLYPKDIELLKIHHHYHQIKKLPLMVKNQNKENKHLNSTEIKKVVSINEKTSSLITNEEEELEKFTITKYVLENQQILNHRLNKNTKSSKNTINYLRLSKAIDQLKKLVLAKVSISLKCELVKSIVETVEPKNLNMFRSKFFEICCRIHSAELVAPLLNFGELLERRAAYRLCLQRLPNSVELWSKFISFEMNNAGDAMGATSIYLQAIRIIDERYRHALDLAWETIKSKEYFDKKM